MRRALPGAEAAGREVDAERVVVSVEVDVRRDDNEMDGRGEAIVDMFRSAFQIRDGVTLERDVYASRKAQSRWEFGMSWSRDRA